MTEFYFITRLCALHDICNALAIVCGVVIGGFTVAVGPMILGDSLEEKTKQQFQALWRKLLYVEVAVLLLFTVTPSTKDAILIYGVGGTVDYIKNNPTASKLPDKFIIYIDELIDKELKDNEKED